MTSQDREAFPALAVFRARRRALVACLISVGAAMTTRDAHAVDLPAVGDAPVTLELTETSIVAQRFRAREGENENDQGYFAWLNRLNTVLSWRRFTLGVRLDSSFYAFRPENRTFSDPQLAGNARIDGSTRYRNALYPAKVFLTYKTPDAELTLGDAYVQFGRGLVLSMRKVDELGIDTTLLGAKFAASKDIFGFTPIAGLANPAPIDEPTGRALFLPKPVGDTLGPQPLFGNDRIVGASVTAGRGLPVVLSTNAAMLTRCAPYRYNADSTVVDRPFDRPIGTCEESDRELFLAKFEKKPADPVVRGRQVINASESLEIPNLGGHGNLYFEGAVQKRDLPKATDDETFGNALYGAFVASGGPVTNTLEMKSYRNFYPLSASVDRSRAVAFANIAYSAPPTGEPVISDTMFGSFNVCVTGGRDRFDYRLTDTLLVYGTFGYFVSLTEQPGSQCDSAGKNTAQLKDESSNHVTDASVGTEWRFDDDKSYAFFNLAARDDLKGTGVAYYREVAGQYTISKHLSGPYSVELAGRHRYRVGVENIGDSFTPEPWAQGEHQTALKIAPKWIFSQGIEYTTQIGLPSLYVNGGILYKFTGQSNIRLYAGQNRGGLRCVSGICRTFPAFSGARAELTVRF